MQWRVYFKLYGRIPAIGWRIVDSKDVKTGEEADLLPFVPTGFPHPAAGYRTLINKTSQ